MPENDLLAECEPLARLLFAYLWMYCDRDGRCEERLRRMKNRLLPYDDCNIDDLLCQLAERDFIIRYEVDGVRYLQVTKFRQNQNPHKGERSKRLPPPPSDEHTTSTIQAPCNNGTGTIPTPDSSNQESGIINQESSIKNQESAGLKHEFEKFWAAYPTFRKRDKSGARKAYRKARRKASAETILTAVREYAASPLGSGRYSKMPASWLNGECWDDERQSWRTDTGPPLKSVAVQNHNAAAAERLRERLKPRPRPPLLPELEDSS